MTTTSWRLVVSPKNLDLEREGDDLIRLTHGEIAVVLDTSGGSARIIVEVDVETPPGVYERLQQHVAGDGAPLTGAAGLSLEQVTWLVGPEDVLQFAADIRHRLKYSALRVMQILRWLGDLTFVSFSGEGELCWSLDGQTWHEAPEEQEPHVYGEPDLFVSEQWRDVLQELTRQEHVAEPLAWQIFHDAVSLLSESPRAAYVLALSAVEVGLKLLPASVSKSDSESWLAIEMPSPPMEKLLLGYLPRLTKKRVAGKPKEAIPPKLREKLKKASERRNKLVHTSEPPPTVEETAQILNATHDLLYLLDWFCGHEWAISHVSAEWLKEYPPAESSA